MNVWFVSSGLMPVFIGGLITIMGIILCHRSIKDGGASQFFQDFSLRKQDSSGEKLRLFALLLVICSYVYLFTPRIDFFLGTILCQVVFISFFYFDRQDLLKKLSIFYLIGCLLFLGLFMMKADKQLNKYSPYFMDVLVLIFFIAYIVYCRVLVRGDGILKKKLKITVITSIVPPLLIISSFKYLLLIPLPVEGAFIDVMNILRYAFH